MDYKKRIRKTGITIMKVAEIIGISHVTLSYYINGAKPMPIHIEEKLKQILIKYEAVV